MNSKATGGMWSPPIPLALSLLPDTQQPGPVDPGILESVSWADLGRASGANDVHRLAQSVVSSTEDQWAYHFWENFMPAILNQGSCYPATPGVIPFLSELARSAQLPTRHRLDVVMALVLIADAELGDLVVAATHGLKPEAEHDSPAAHTAVGDAVPALVALWPGQPPAIQFALAILAGLYPAKAEQVTDRLGRMAHDYAGTRPGEYLDLAAKLLGGDEPGALSVARSIAIWDDDHVDEKWLDAPGLTARVTCGHFLSQGSLHIAANNTAQ